MEHVRVLGHDADRVVQRLLGYALDVAAAYPDRSRPRVIKPGHQVRDRGLARAGRPDQRGQLAGRGMEADVTQHVSVGVGPLGYGQRDRLE